MKYDFNISCNQIFKTNQHKLFPSFFLFGFLQFFLLPMFMKNFIHYHFSSTFSSINIIHPWTHGKILFYVTKYYVPCVKWVQVHRKEPTGLLYKRFLNPFLFFFSFFHMKEFFNEIFCNLLLNIHIVAAINNIFYVNHCWINMIFSKCVNFARFYISFWKFIIILNNAKICKLL
jgi:hypothetical protein